jgi:uncharacterized RDD family membrane protein YckC
MTDLPDVFPEPREYEPVETFPIEFYPLEMASMMRRLCADWLDMLLLGLAMFLIMLFAQSFFYASGPHGRVYGFVLTVTYFTIFSSRLGGGQTPGKRIMGIVVVDARGRCLTVRRAFVRSMMLCAIYLLNGWDLKLFTTSIIFGLAATTLVLGGILSLIYAYVFNRVTRQGPHDLLVGSYVVYRPDPYTQYQAPPGRRLHQQMVAGLFALSFIVALIGFVVLRNSRFGDLQKALLTDDRFMSANLKSSLGHEYLDISVWVEGDCPQTRCEAMTADIAQVTLVHYDALAGDGTLNITLFKAIDLGFSSMVRSLYHASATRTDWRTYLIRYYDQAAERAYQEGDDESAVEAYTRLVELDPTGTEWRTDLIQYYGQTAEQAHQEGDYKSAIEAYTRVIELDPARTETYANRALAYYEQQNYDSALADLYQYRELVGQDSAALQWANALIARAEQQRAESGQK